MKKTKLYAGGMQLKYEGELKDGKRNGQGMLSIIIDNELYENYTGEFKDDEYNGYGIHTVSKSKYVGEFKDGKYSGQGIINYNYSLNNGNTYIIFENIAKKNLIRKVSYRKNT